MQIKVILPQTFYRATVSASARRVAKRIRLGLVGIGVCFGSLLLESALKGEDARADGPAVDFAALGANGLDYYQGSYSLGWRFRALTDVKVTSLGFYDDKMNGLIQNHDVGIFDATSCQLLASATVTPNDPLTGFFHYHPVNPVVLPGGREYFIAAVNGEERYAINVEALAVDPKISFLGFAAKSQTVSTSTLQCPDGSFIAGFRGDFGPNFTIAADALPPPPSAPEKRGTATSVSCNRGPNPADDYLCTATVGPQDNSSPKASGEVQWTIANNQGSFPYGNKCILNTEGTGATSYCSVVFSQARPLIPLGSPVPVVASYLGDSIDLPSASSSSVYPTGSGLPATPTTPVCIGDDPGSCAGLNAVTPSVLSSKRGIPNVLVSYFGAFGTSAARSVSQLTALRAPRRRGNVSFHIYYTVAKADNPVLAQIAALPKARPSIQVRNILIGHSQGELRFGQSKDQRVSMSDPGRLLLQIAPDAKASSLNVRVTVQAIRSGDRRPTTVSSLVNIPLQ